MSAARQEFGELGERIAERWLKRQGYRVVQRRFRIGHRDIDHCLTVRTDSIHRVQETHVALYHILWDLTHTLLADDRGPGVEKA